MTNMLPNYDETQIKNILNDYLIPKAEKGDVESQNSIAFLYKTGTGVEKNFGIAMEWYSKAAEGGIAESQFHLAMGYLNGEGVKQNLNQAGYWFRKAAEQGYDAAQNNLGIMYENKNNFNLAYTWYAMASINGSDRGEFNKIRLKSKIQPEKIKELEILAQKCIDENYKDSPY